ncbi:MAG TPA: YdcF family protein, partial [Bacillota bacterium]|nr:YdcF family protein [Bacillota bacterium]
GLSVALFVLFGPNFGVIFVVLLIAFWLLIVMCRHLYTLTQCRLYRIVDRLLSVLISSFLAILLMVAYFISSEYHSDEGALEEMDYVIILGAGLKGVEPSKTLIGRLDTGLNYLRYHPNVPVILSGGRGPGENTTEAEAMAKYLTNRGIDQDQLILESHSRTTAENFAFSKALMNKKNGKELKVLIITSDYHLFRAKQIAKETGYVIYGKASESPILLRINYTIRECFGVIQTFLIMKINSLQEGLI